MKKLGLFLFATLISSSLLANDDLQNERFIFGVTEGNYRVGSFEFGSCDIIVPNFGVAHQYALEQLRELGFNPIVSENDYMVLGRSIVVAAAGKKVLRHFVHRDEKRQGTMYLDVDVTAGLGATQTTLGLLVVGEEGMEPLYESRGYDSHLLPGHTDVFDPSDFPKCEKIK